MQLTYRRLRSVTTNIDVDITLLLRFWYALVQVCWPLMGILAVLETMIKKIHILPTIRSQASQSQ